MDIEFAFNEFVLGLFISKISLLEIITSKMLELGMLISNILVPKVFVILILYNT